MMVDASIWREEIRQKQKLTMAWQIAALTRAKRMPSFKQLLNMKPARPLYGDELERRRKEFADMTKNLDMSKLKIPERPDVTKKRAD
jgi:hypothetical protein